MSHSSEDKVTLREFLSEGLKLTVLLALFGVGSLALAAYGCNHGACHLPDTWEPIVQFFGR